MSANTSTIDFVLVKMAHQTWRLKLRAYLNGKEEVDPKQLSSHADCSLGKWIYSAGTAQYGGLRDFQELEKTHKLMHEAVKGVVDMKRLGRTEEAESEFLKVRELADQVVALITAVEKHARSR